VTFRDWAIIFAVVFWGALVVVVCWALTKVVALLEEATRDLRETTDRILPTLEQVTETAAGVNVELARVDTIVAGVQSITATTDQLVGVVHATVSNPLIKAAAFAAGTAKATKKLRD
jgi:predicted PurR-regulated permease PerM